MLLGIYGPIIIHDLQNAPTYWQNVISNQTLEFKYLESCFELAKITGRQLFSIYLTEYCHTLLGRIK